MNYKLQLINIKKNYNSLEAIKDISLNIKKGEIIAIVGKSGCGKSTLLNIISGLDKETSGKCIFDNDNPKIGYMLQTDALLPFRTILDNACIGLEINKTKTKENVNYVKKLLKDYGLLDFINTKPSSLSGGMRQRVALIRSLAIKPDILLLDEPFSALDYYTRITIADDVYKILKKTKTTTIIITHDIAEALSLGDRVLVLSDRPSTIKKEYDVPFKNESSSKQKRSLKEFNELYEIIWREIDNEL